LLAFWKRLLLANYRHDWNSPIIVTDHFRRRVDDCDTQKGRIPQQSRQGKLTVRENPSVPTGDSSILRVLGHYRIRQL